MNKINNKTFCLYFLLNEIHEDITENIENLNDGGCGFFAFYFYKAIKVYFPQTKIISFCDILGEIKHICVQIDDYIIDGEDVMFPDDHEVYMIDNYCFTQRKELNFDELEFLLKNNPWNLLYNNQQNAHLEEIINNHTKKLTNMDLNINDLNYTQMCVWPGVVVADKKEYFEQLFKDKFDIRVKFIAEVEALETNGRHDVFFMVHSDEVNISMIRKMNKNIQWWETILNKNGLELYGEEIIKQYPKNW